MRKRKLNNNINIFIFLLVVSHCISSCTARLDEKYPKISIKLVMGLDYKCTYYYDGTIETLQCNDSERNCEKEINTKQRIPKLVSRIFEKIKLRRYNYDNNDGVFLSIIRTDKYQSDTLIFNGFNSSRENNELKEVDEDAFNLYKYLVPCF